MLEDISKLIRLFVTFTGHKMVSAYVDHVTHATLFVLCADSQEQILDLICLIQRAGTAGRL